MSQDLCDFERQLGEELRAAAYRRIEASDTRPVARRWFRVCATGLAAIVVLALAGFVIVDLRPQPVSAHPFKIIRLTNEIHLEIIDLLEDPRAAEEELKEELGIDIAFVAVPTPPELLNEIRSVISSGTTTAAVVFDEAGRSERIILPKEIDGRLVIQYGREALPGERYLYNVTSPICRELWGRTPRESLAHIGTLAPDIRYDTIDPHYNYRSDMVPEDINPDYRLIDALFLAEDELLVVYSAHLDALGANRPNCGSLVGA
ncbi:MAG: hypothetical protein OXB92_11385 [Acidimicrobiaceae bacterium]|nr:hypothetical protein [Acidimicrobiia bacterium]MCY4494446.1 hypothetical protein [Acidimicrobiaceae bacterium]